MRIFDKKPKLDFVCALPGVERIYPIDRMRLNDFEWMKKAKQDFSNNKENFINPTSRQIHITRCPGIFNILQTGWVQRAWQDITIETMGNETDFRWNTPTSQKEYGNDPWVLEYVGAHEDLVQRYTNDFRNLKNVIKIQSPWYAYIPKGYSLLIEPIPYPDHTDWQAAPGIIKSLNGGPVALSPQLLFYKNPGKTLIKAGTPLHVIYLLKDALILKGLSG